VRGRIRSRRDNGGRQTAGRPNDLIVLNYTSTSVPATVRIADPDGTVTAQGRYELPNELGIVFADVAGWEATYSIALAVGGGEPMTLEWATEPCGGEATHSRDASLRVFDGDDGGYESSLFIDECDVSSAPEYPTVPAAEFRMAEREPTE